MKWDEMIDEEEKSVRGKEAVCDGTEQKDEEESTVCQI